MKLKQTDQDDAHRHSSNIITGIIRCIVYSKSNGMHTEMSALVGTFNMELIATGPERLKNDDELVLRWDGITEIELYRADK